LVLEAAVAHFAQPIEEHRSGQGILGLAPVQPDLDPAAQFSALQPFERKQSPLDATKLSERHCQSILSRLTAQLAQH
jgi:hypothetical protein